MFTKTILSAAVLTASLVTLNSTAQASDGSIVVRDHRTKIAVRDHRTKVTVRDHRKHRRNEVVLARWGSSQNKGILPGARKYPCALGRDKLWWQGYRVSFSDCKSYTFKYRATRDGMLFAASMSPYTGFLSIKMLGFAH